jgi:serine/threonine-protein kinase
MASLFPGYEYDIFISYRQKDNKGDKWVSEFVDALKTELESTFKEEINVYFDINPHDGLLDTHDVDASLKEKLKCLIFIPVISRTYCDPRSFAWEHEFKAFIDLASRDKFGLKIRLPNGNMVNRVLPVRIYDIEVTDIKLCESILGDMLHGVDFVYKEPGVNRPLTPEDDEEKNLNNTRYRNQINKTANAIKEIISGLRSETKVPSKDMIRQKEYPGKQTKDNLTEESSSQKMFSRKAIKRMIVLLLGIICIIGAFAAYKIVNMAKTRKTIAVFYSPDIKNDTTLKNICDAYTENTHTNLKALKKLIVRPRSALLPYRDNFGSLKSIGKDLGVNYSLVGIVSRNGNNVKIWVELTSTKDYKELWSKEYKWDSRMISKNITEIVQAVARCSKMELTPDAIKQIGFEPTQNAEANLNYSIANSNSYDAVMSFNMANKYMKSVSFISAIKAYDKAIEEDSMFAQAYAKRATARAWSYYTRQLDSTQIEKCLEDIAKASEINNDLTETLIAQGFYYYYCKKDLEKALEFFNNAAQKDTGDYEPLFYAAMVYRRMGKWNETSNLIKQIIALDPQEALCLTNIGLTYTYFHKYDSALMFHQKAIDVMPAWVSPYKNKIEALILKYGNTIEAWALLDTAVIRTGNNLSEFKIILDIYDREYAEALKEAEKSHPGDFGINGKKYMMLGRIYDLLKNSKNARVYYDSALVCFKNEIENDKDNSEIQGLIGLAYAGEGDKNNAISEGKRAVALVKFNSMDKSDMILNLARIYTMVGEYDQAINTIDYLLPPPLNIPNGFSANLLQIDPGWKPLMNQQAFKTLRKKFPVN